MELKTISASSLLTFDECPRRFQAENVEYAPRADPATAAKVGTAVHATLQDYVQVVYVEKVHAEDLNFLIKLFRSNYTTEFGSNYNTDMYKDGVEMLENWFARTFFDENTEILHLEEKLSIQINTKAGPKPYNFIWDRCDKITEDGKVKIRVVDYKTIREPLSPDQLFNKIQARMYGFAAAVKFKHLNPDEIWVCFDLLRYGTVEVMFSREDNLATWKYIKDTANAIIDTKVAEERLGPGCQYCVRNTTCKTLRKNAYAGGVMGLAGNRKALAEAHYELTSQLKGLKAAAEQITALMFSDAKETDEIEYDTDGYHVIFKSRKTRSYDPEVVRNIVGDDIYATLGGVSVTAVDKLLKGDELDPIKKSLLRSSIAETFSEPKPTVTKRPIK